MKNEEMKTMKEQEKMDEWTDVMKTMNAERLSGMDGDMMQMNEKEEDCDRDDGERHVKT